MNDPFGLLRLLPPLFAKEFGREIRMQAARLMGSNDAEERQIIVNRSAPKQPIPASAMARPKNGRLPQRAINIAKSQPGVITLQWDAGTSGILVDKAERRHPCVYPATPEDLERINSWEKVRNPRYFPETIRQEPAPFASAFPRKAYAQAQTARSRRG